MENSKNISLDIALIAGHLDPKETTSSSTPTASTPDLPQEKEGLSNDTNLKPQKLEAELGYDRSSLPAPSQGVSESIVKEEELIPGLDETTVEASSSANSRPEHLVESKTELTAEIPFLTEQKESSLSTLLAKHNLELVSSDSSDNDTSESETTEDTKSDSESKSEEESDSSSSESNDSFPVRDEDENESEEGATKKRIKAKKRLDKMIKDDAIDSGSESETARGRPTFATAHEVISPSVSMPSITEIPDKEPIELIGEVLSIVDSVVVVKSSQDGMQRVLDTDSLLVFEDRKVLGLIFETFGPLSAPLYSLRFPSSTHIPANTSISRKVFYCPQRCTFAYTSSLLLQKGNDASNFYDEEVGDEEIEFSDDEAEKEWKRQKDVKTGRNKRRRGSKAGSRAGSVRGEDDASNWNEDTTLPYDDDFMGQEAPIVLSYDDPYAEPPPNEGETSITKPSPRHDLSARRAPRGRPELSSRPYSTERPGHRGRGGSRGRGRNVPQFPSRGSFGRGSAPNRNNNYYENYGNGSAGPMASTHYDATYTPSYNPAFAGNPPMMPPSMPFFGTTFPLNSGAINNVPPFFNGMNQAQFPGPVGSFPGRPNSQVPHLGMVPMGGPTMGPGAPVPGAHINPMFAMQLGLMNGTMAPAGTAQNARWSGNDTATENLDIQKEPE